MPGKKGFLSKLKGLFKSDKEPKTDRLWKEYGEMKDEKDRRDMTTITDPKEIKKAKRSDKKRGKVVEKYHKEVKKHFGDQPGRSFVEDGALKVIPSKALWKERDKAAKDEKQNDPLRPGGKRLQKLWDKYEKAADSLSEEEKKVLIQAQEKAKGKREKKGEKEEKQLERQMKPKVRTTRAKGVSPGDKQDKINKSDKQYVKDEKKQIASDRRAEEKARKTGEEPEYEDVRRREGEGQNIGGSTRTVKGIKAGKIDKNINQEIGAGATTDVRGQQQGPEFRGAIDQAAQNRQMNYGPGSPAPSQIGTGITKDDIKGGKRRRAPGGRASGPMNFQDYYPSGNEKPLQGYVRVGKYNLPIFAMGAPKFPWALLDQREKALSEAAEIATKTYQAPEIENKHYQQQLQNQWFTEMNDYMNQAYKDYGSGAEAMLANPNTAIGAGWEAINNKYVNLGEQSDYVGEIVSGILEPETKDGSEELWYPTRSLKTAGDFMAGKYNFSNGQMSAEDFVKIQDKLIGTETMAKVYKEYKDQVDSDVLPAIDQMINSQVASLEGLEVQMDKDGVKQLVGDLSSDEWQDLADQYGMPVQTIKSPGGYNIMLYAATVDYLGGEKGRRIAERLVDEKYYDVSNFLSEEWNMPEDRTGFDQLKAGSPEEQEVYNEIIGDIQGDLMDMYAKKYDIKVQNEPSKTTFNYSGPKKEKDLAFYTEVAGHAVSESYKDLYKNAFSWSDSAGNPISFDYLTLDQKRQGAKELAKSINNFKQPNSIGRMEEFFRMNPTPIENWTEKDFAKPVRASLFAGKKMPDMYTDLTLERAIDNMSLQPLTSGEFAGQDPKEVLIAKLKESDISLQTNVRAKITEASQGYMNPNANDGNPFTWDQVMANPGILDAAETNPGAILDFHIGPAHAGMPIREGDEKASKAEISKQTEEMAAILEALMLFTGSTDTKGNKVSVDQGNGYTISLNYDLDQIGDRNELETNLGRFSSLYASKRSYKASPGSAPTTKGKKSMPK